MSSVPVQFLISVIPEPNSTEAPVIIPLRGYLEITANVFNTFNL